MNALEMEEGRKVRRKNKLNVARLNDKLMIGARVIYKRNVDYGVAKKYGCRLVA